jgi:hypothetical protein
MNISILNCQGLGNRTEFCGVLAHQMKEILNIIFLSETKFGERRVERLRMLMDMLMDMPNTFVKNCEGMSGGLACKD